MRLALRLLSSPAALSVFLVVRMIRYACKHAAALSTGGGPAPLISPCGAALIGVLVQFTDYHKTQAPVGTVEGFDLSTSYDQATKRADTATPGELDCPVSLWEYEHTYLTKPMPLLRFDFHDDVADVAGQ